MSRAHQAEPLSSLAGLSHWCEEERFVIKDVSPNEAAITDPDGASIWWLYRVEGWLQVKGLVFEEVNATEALCLSLARLHTRLLGCRYGIDEENNLLIHADLFPHDQSGSAVGAAIIQMQAIVDSTFDLLLRVQENGIAADESAIDEDFKLRGSAPLH
ncbi:hypothetical protein [Sphingomonas sp.]|uniref:hypothetical protein n=1 Tax=Sphingomonas sp. TaxID=28214 RepID=UPI0017905142|nr:hypothetical protein [Sphingomonas sp.]MBA3511672.1 hypothetical protein [Sphingomonas sp.]